ncbi:MAG: hypothetical protein EHM55_04580 [Acidobacteria bacterium]|nr:MAG: hypothetical protein EHM55_04580 [Acidobacteriota bacterium]
MNFRRVSVLAGAVVLAASVCYPSFAQEKPPAPEPQRKLSGDERREYIALSETVDAVMAGKEPAPADLKLKFQSHFLKSNETVYIPYIVEVGGGKFSSFPVAMYVRAVQKGAPPPTGKGIDAEWPFADAYFLTEKNIVAAGDVSEVPRALQLPAGEYTLYVAMRERQGRDRKVLPKTAVIAHDLSVPDLNTGLTTSSVIMASGLNPAPEQLTAQQQLEQPFTISGYKVVPSFGKPIPQSGELMFVFFIYNEGVAAGTGKPDLDVDYLFYRANEEKPFTKLATQAFNATTLPGQFDVKAGHQVFVGQGIPVKGAIQPGDYRMEIKVSDKTNGQTITRNVNFTVTD